MGRRKKKLLMAAIEYFVEETTKDGETTICDALNMMDFDDVAAAEEIANHVLEVLSGANGEV